jgi:hypothetical protein
VPPQELVGSCRAALAAAQELQQTKAAPEQEAPGEAAGAGSGTGRTVPKRSGPGGAVGAGPGAGRITVSGAGSSAMAEGCPRCPCLGSQPSDGLEALTSCWSGG